MEAKQSDEPAAVQPVEQGRTIRRRAGQTGMSYKFQRLREKIRSAIASGELHGKLPGERALAKRFHVNAKTLSKALTDLAAEGVLDRSIGRGTYVKGSEPAASTEGRWLLLGDEQTVDSPLLAALREINPEILISTGVSELRPSFLNQFAAVINVSQQTPDSFLRDLVVRNIPVVTVNREPQTYSMHAVLFDSRLNATRLGRELALLGHHRLTVVEPDGSTAICLALRQAVERINKQVTVDVCSPQDVAALVEGGITGVVCHCPSTGEAVRGALDRAGVQIPHRASVVALGCVGDNIPCSGYYAGASEMAQAVAGLLRDGGTGKPTTLWLAGAWHDRQTLGPARGASSDNAATLRLDGVMV